MWRSLKKAGPPRTPCQRSSWREARWRRGSGAGAARGTAAGCTRTSRSAPSSASPPAAPAARPTLAADPHSLPGTGSTGEEKSYAEARRVTSVLKLTEIRKFGGSVMKVFYRRIKLIKAAMLLRFDSADGQ